MSLAGEQVLLRVYLRNADRAPHVPTWERLLKAARSEGLRGATVLRGILGFGSRGVLRAGTWSLIEHIPIIVEIVDTSERITAFLSGAMAELMTSGMATLERAAVMMYRHRGQDPQESLQLSSLLQPLST